MWIFFFLKEKKFYFTLNKTIYGERKVKSNFIFYFSVEREIESV